MQAMKKRYRHLFRADQIGQTLPAFRYYRFHYLRQISCDKGDIQTGVGFRSNRVRMRLDEETSLTERVEEIEDIYPRVYGALYVCVNNAPDCRHQWSERAYLLAFFDYAIP